MSAAHITLFLILTQESHRGIHFLTPEPKKSIISETIWQKLSLKLKYKYDHLPEVLHDPNEKNGLSFELHCHCGVFKTLN